MILKFKDTDAHYVLRNLYIEREMTWSKFLELFPKKFGDHRDFYIAASLFKQGYVDCTLSYSMEPFYKNSKYHELDNYALALQLYFRSLGKGEHEYRQIKSQVGDFGENDPVYATHKVDLYFQERSDKLTTIIASLLLAIFSALIGAMFVAIFSNG